MSFTYDGAEVWLDDLSAPLRSEPGIELCSRHADTKTAPVGWTLTDRRLAGDRHLFIPREPANVA
jgi:hypothetical protein